VNRRSTFLALGIVALTLSIDTALAFSGAEGLGMIAGLSTLVFAAIGAIWLMRLRNAQITVRRVWVVFPAGVFFAAIAIVFERSGLLLKPFVEDLRGVGNLMMARYQIGVWILSIVVLLTFVTASTLLERNR
jgi:hypothetical protein